MSVVDSDRNFANYSAMHTILLYFVTVDERTLEVVGRNVQNGTGYHQIEQTKTTSIQNWLSCGTKHAAPTFARDFN